MKLITKLHSKRAGRAKELHFCDVTPIINIISNLQSEFFLDKEQNNLDLINNRAILPDNCDDFNINEQLKKT
jgi:hypothetical protein